MCEDSVCRPARPSSNDNGDIKYYGDDYCDDVSNNKNDN